MREKYLEVKVWLISLFRYLRLIDDVWYASELELARIKSDRLAEFFNKKSIGAGSGD